MLNNGSVKKGVNEQLGYTVCLFHQGRLIPILLLWMFKKKAYALMLNRLLAKLIFARRKSTKGAWAFRRGKPSVNVVFRALL